ncbi:hypothetical protein RUND412_009415, partial [Rhizina undulata]
IDLLLEIVENAEPNWRSIKLPKGRTKNQAQSAYETMKSTKTAASSGEHVAAASSKKRSLEQTASEGTFGQTASPQTEPVATSPAEPPKRKRGRPTKAEAEARKAAIAKGEYVPKARTYVPKSPGPTITLPDGTVKRRRGRPTKAETEARKAAERDRRTQETAQRKTVVQNNANENEEEEEEEEEEE